MPSQRAALLPRLRAALGRLVVLLGTAAAALVLGATAAAATGSPVFGAAPPDGRDPVRTWTWSTSGDPSIVRVSCTLVHVAGGRGDTTVVASNADCGTSLTFDLAGRPSGLYRLGLVAYDAAGTPGPEVTQSTNYTGPAIPTITSSPAPSPGAATTVSWSYTYTEGNSPVCTLAHAGVVVRTVTGCPATVSFTLTSGDGEYTFGVRTSVSETATSTYVLDTTAPAATLAGPSGPSAVRDPAFTLSGGEPGAVWACSLTDPAGVLTKLECAPGTVRLSLPGADGQYTLTAQVSDALSNSRTVSAQYVLDTRPLPAPTVTAPTGPSSDRAPVAQLSSSEPGVAWHCSLTGPGGTTYPACSAGSWTLTLAGLPDGTYVGRVSTSKNGRTSPVVQRSYVLDTTPPPAPAITGSAGPSSSAVLSVALEGEAGGSWTCTLTSPGGVVSSPLCSAGQNDVALAADDGTWTLAVVQQDAAGNRSATSTWSYVLDTTAPASPSVTGPAGPSLVTRPVFELAGEADGRFSCTLTGPDGATTAVPCAAGALTLDLTADGTWTLGVTVTDAAGHVSPERSVTYRLDTAAPAAPSVTGPAGPSSVTRPAFTLAGEAAGRFSCTLTRPDGVATPVSCAAGTLTLDLTLDGSWTLEVTVTDEAGNTSPVRSVTYLLDSSAPAAPSVTGPAGPAAATRPRYELGGEAGGQFSCLLTGPDGTSTAVACTAGSLVLDLAGDGTWTLEVTVTDAAGNTSPVRSVTYLLDTAAPSAPSVTGPAGPSSVTRPVFELAGEAGGRFSCVLTGPDGVATAVACVAGSLALDLTQDGTWTLDVTVTDAAGNVSPVRSVTYLLDTAAPAAPSVAGPSGPSSVTRPVFELSGEPGGRFSCLLTGPDGTATSVPCAAGPLTLDLTGDGTWTLDVTVTDAAGNVSLVRSVTYLLDTAAPDAPSVTGPAGPSSVTRPVFELAGEPGSRFSCTLTAPDGTTTAVSCAAGSLTLDLTDDGTWTLDVTVTDAAGNVSPLTSVTYLLDTAAPAAPSVTGPSGPSSVTRPVFKLAGEPGGRFSCALTAPDGTTTTVPCAAGPLTLDLTGDGTWTLDVTVTDAAGNTSPLTSVTYLLDTAAPAAPSVIGPAGPSSQRRPVFELAGEPGSRFSCTLTAPDGTTTAVPCTAGSLTLDLTQDGTWTLDVTVTDAAGNVSPLTSLTYLLDTSAPAAPSVTGPTGPSSLTRPTFELAGEPGSRFSCTLTGPDGVSTSVPCAAGSLILDLTGDGTWTLDVTVTDAAGNTSPLTSVIYLLDTAAPAAPSVTGPAGPSSQRSPVFELAGEAGGRFSCTLTGPDGVTTAVACAAGSLTLDLTGDGTWTLDVTVTDAAGNVSPLTSVTYLLDTAAPAAPSVTGPAGPSSQRSPVFELAGEPGGRFSCTLTGPDGVTTAVACAAGSLTLDLTDDGTWTLDVTVTDAAGNASPLTSVTYLLDTAAPAAPSVTGPAGPSSLTRPAFELAGEPGGRFSCLLTGPDGTATSVPCAAGPLTLDLTQDGPWTLDVTVADAAGNVSPLTWVTYLLDTAAPAAPSVTGPSGPSSVTRPTFVLAGEPGGRFSCTLTAPDGTTSSVPCATGSLTLDLTQDGTWTLDVTVTDAAGNVSPVRSVTYLLDTAAPAAPSVTGPSGPSSDTRPVLELAGEPGSRFSCTLNAPDGTTTAVPCAAGSLTLDLAGDGIWTLDVNVTDAAGNVSPVRSVTYLLDTAAPAAPSVTGPTGPSSMTRPVFKLSGEPGGRFSCLLTAPDGTATSVPCAAGPLTLDLTGDGTWTLDVTVTDAAGNASPLTSVTYLLDTAAPAAPSVTGPAGPSSQRRPVFELAGEPGGRFSCTLTGPDGVSTSVPCAAGSLTLDLTGDGTWTLDVTVTDAAGNISPLTSVTYLLDTAAPAAPSVTGPAGPSSQRSPVFELAGEPGSRFSCTLTAPDGTTTSVPCAAGSLTLDLTDDGTWTLDVTVTDAAGNASPLTSVTYLLDTAAPAAPSVTGPAGPSSQRRPVFELAGEPGSRFSCALTGPDGVSTSVPCAAGSLTLDLTGDGTWTLDVTVTDAAGNVSPLTSVTYLLDTAAPAAPSVTGPAGPSSLTRPTFELAGEAGGRFSCTLTGPDGVSTSVPCAAGSLTLDLTPDGTWTLDVTVTDAAGNVSPLTSVTYLLDTVAPAAPSVTGPSGPSSVTSPVFELDGDAGGRFACTLTAPDGTTTAVPCTAGSLTLDLTQDGTWTLDVTVTDAAGNVSPVRSVTYLLDTSAPAAPSVTGPSGPSSVTRPVFELAGEPGSRFSCTLTGPDGVSTSVPCAAGSLTLDLTQDGTWTLDITVTDAAGNVSPLTSVTYLLDTAAPAAPSVTGPAGPSSERQPSFELSGEPGSRFSCTLTAPDGTTTAVPCAAGPLTLDLTDDGTWTLDVTVTDAAGNVSPLTSVTYLLDTVAPAAPSVTGPAGPSSQRRPSFELAGEPGSRFSCTLTAPDGTTTAVPCDAGPLTLDLTDDGTWTLDVTLTDAAGLVSERAVRRLELDTTGPDAPLVEPALGADGTWKIDAEAGATVECTLVGPDGSARAVPCASGVVSVRDRQLAPGTWTLVVEAVDARGNRGAQSRTAFTVEAPRAPEPAAVPPAPAPPAPSAVVEPVAVPDELPREAVVGLAAVVATALPVVPDAVAVVARLAVAEAAAVRALQRFRAPAAIESRWRDVLRVVGVAAAVSGVPLLLLLLVLLFLAVQDRIDRNDPKLALAPLNSHQELPFHPFERHA